MTLHVPLPDELTLDTVRARLVQARAAILAVQNTWNEDRDAPAYKLPEKLIYEALWGVEELLAQGIRAGDAVAYIRI